MSDVANQLGDRRPQAKVIGPLAQALRDRRRFVDYTIDRHRTVVSAPMTSQELFAAAGLFALLGLIVLLAENSA